MDSISLFAAPKKRVKKANKAAQEEERRPRLDAEEPAAPNELDAAQHDGLTAVNEEDTAVEGFRQLGISEWLDKVCEGLGMRTPTAVQRGCIPAILEGRDVIGIAHTGSGKTAAFALPILQRLAKDPFGVFALVLTPTRCRRRPPQQVARVPPLPSPPASTLGTPTGTAHLPPHRACCRPCVRARRPSVRAPTFPAGSWPSSWRTSFERWAPAWRCATAWSSAGWTCRRSPSSWRAGHTS
jgi:hypothetical protein